MKILVVSNGYPPRGRFGTEFYTRELVRGLAARGHEPAVLHPVRGGRGGRDGSRPRYAVEEVREEGVPVLLLANPGDRRKRFEASWRDPGVERAFDGVLARLRPDLVHFVYLGWGLSFGLPARARARGVPCLVTLTDYNLFCHRGQMVDFRLERCGGPHPPAVCARCIREPSAHDLPPARLALKRLAVRALAAAGGAGRVVVERDVARREQAVAELLGHVARFVAPTRSMAAVAARAGVPRERLLELCYAFDEAPYAAAHPAPEGVFRFGYCGQLAPHKGVGTLLEAAALLARERGLPPWELVLHGSAPAGRHGAFWPALQARGLPAGVRLEPPFEPAGAPAVLAGLSTLVVPSTWDENAPLACLEARAAGLPLVASDVPGIAEVAAAPLHARLVPPGDPARLAEALAAALREDRRRTGRPGLPLSLERHLDVLEALYVELAGGPPAPELGGPGAASLP